MKRSFQDFSSASSSSNKTENGTNTQQEDEGKEGKKKRIETDLKFNGKGFYLNRMNGSPTSGDTITIEEILQIHQVKSIFLTTFSLEMDFLKQVIITPLVKQRRSCSITLVKHYDRNQEKEGKNFIQLSNVVQLPLCVIHPKLITPFSNMHTKLWILEFEHFLRVVVTSANFTNFDFYSCTQVIWIQDFPVKTSAPSGRNTAFEKDLIDAWKSLTSDLPHQWFTKYDFSNAQVQLVVSTPGYHKSTKLNQYGYLRIGHLVQPHKSTLLNNLKQIPIFYQSSTIGTIDTNYMQQINSSIASKTTPFRIAFPTLENVMNSALTMNGAGMIYLKEKTFTNDKFPKTNMIQCDVKSVQAQQQNHLLHSKMIFHMGYNPHTNKAVGWIYMGSHNLSTPALGKLQKNESQCFVANYEMGVLFGPKEYELEQASTSSGPSNNATNQTNQFEAMKNGTFAQIKEFHFPIPFSVEAPIYNLQTDSPWIMEQFLGENADQE